MTGRRRVGSTTEGRSTPKSDRYCCSLLDAMQESIMVIDRDYRITDVNDNLVSMTGFERERLVGRYCYEISHGYSQPCPENFEQCAVRKVFEDGRPHSCRHEHLGKQGSKIWVDILCSPLKDDRGEVTRVIQAGRDVTDLIELSRALHKSEERYRTLFNEMLGGFAMHEIVLDENGKPQGYRFLDVNPSFERHTGLKRVDIIGKNIRDVLPNLEPGWLEKYHHVALTGKPARFESYSKELGKHFEVSAFRPREGQFAVIISDITERKKAVRALKKHSERMEEMVEQRTQELRDAQEEMIKNEKLSVLGRLTATVSHELRNPLGVIRSSVFYLKRRLDDDDEKTTKHLARIEEQVDLCDTIVGELLEYTRGRRSQAVPGEINPWIIEVLGKIEVPHPLRLVQELSPGLPQVAFDKEKIRRALTNLIENAVHAVTARREDDTGEGETRYQPLIRVATSRAGTAVQIEVEDNGVGMENETASRAFEPLYTTRARGTGLGLAIVKKIVEEHDGSAHLESGLHQGTKVTLLIPEASRSPATARQGRTAGAGGGAREATNPDRRR